MVELRARYQRAEIVSEFLVDGLLWIGRGVKALAKGFAARARLVAAERQLEALDDRMLADLGVKRGDIPFAVRRAPQGVAPEFGGVAHVVPAANLDMHRAA
ncbi:MAG: DUF1127 domain-containing protein [Alphaproteobacteria bacterium]|nr:DUF1127 domain-containing protein [Alphaproteobacteria bacterium]